GLLARQNDDGDLVSVAIGSRALDILGLLIDRHGDVVSKEEILNAVWPGVVEGANVTVQISALRCALDDGRPSLIQTIPRRGYRFVAKPYPVSLPAEDTPQTLPQRPAASPRGVSTDSHAIRPG